MFSKIFKVVVLAVTVIALLYPFMQSEDQTQAETKSNKLPAKKLPKIKEKPLHNVDLPDFGAITDVKKKKSMFFDFIKPHVEAENKLILEQRATLEIALMMLQYNESLSLAQLEKISDIFESYNMPTTDIDEMSLKAALHRVDIIPKELALMQAANESAWGTSRFARIGLNFFGQWCYTKGCGMVPRLRDDEAAHEVKAFKSVRAAVKSYFRNINTHNAYLELRNVRAQLRAQKEPIAATKLTAGLMSYSERGEDYIEELNDMIRHNRAYFNEE
ncbi:glucosaminidase domain-containing protein [Pseudoalteromonas sp. T1lg65]|uniref:glucosaminidase domain-containing protein n=1 Tax=Pseudoalteromonas sp. T1lg65 TaxID=2077101 RepID=UPI003F7ACCF6